MGTTWRVLYAGHHVASDIRTIIEARLDAIVGEMSHWRPTSHLCRFNRAAPGEWVSLPSDFATVIDTSLRVASASDGAFDPAIGALVDLWGFGPPGPMPTPGDDAIAAACAVSGWRRLRWDPAGARLRQSGGLALDLSGIAKGFAADAVAGTLSTHGIEHALVEIGGELVGRGVQPSGEPWWVDLETPPGIALPPLRIALHGLAVATSGNYVRGAHSLDPRTRRPAANGVVSVSVVARTAMLADALATAMAVGYPGDQLAGMDVAARIIVGNDDGVTEILTPALHRMLSD
ncbi:FAD:protein FMN transferase [uncultured Sphingomonas sp.]|uniref:FAD:protein FMN transferase n=1 Tax=uncultured Sphingomonas sp. TaxID=158754 RepID=UPI0025DF8178|nr:FAD:protein FMN transferase [uncultured Sphingomonas sp.]